MEKTPDRVSISLGQKINLGNYQSLDFHFSYSTDLVDGETPDDAKKRAESLVLTWAKEASIKYSTKKKT
jgi:hypothetical protein